jgi:ribosomal protein S14
VFLLGVALFYTGRLVNGEVARKARQDAEEALRQAHEEQMELMRQRFDEMQTAWRERCEEVARERNYYRAIALSKDRQVEQALTLAQDKYPRL